MTADGALLRLGITLVDAVNRFAIQVGRMFD